MNNLREKVLKTIQKYNLINDKDRIVIGVSGGPDSMCLLHILIDLKKQLNFDIVVAHINHMIRPEADSETEYVMQFCKNMGVECYVKKTDVIGKANQEKIGTEEAGRKVRYDFFEEIAQKVNANKIATAHNANDNAETILMNIFRGTGTSGLKGIEPIRNGKYIRPIIECERKEIEEYCEINCLEPKIDKSNFDNTYTRNKIRNIVIPQIKQEFNPNIIESLNKLSTLARQENDFINEYIEKVIKNELIIKDINKDNELIIDLKRFNCLDKFIKSKVILSLIRRVLGSTQGIEMIHVEDIILLCEKNVGNKFLTPNKKIKVMVNKGKVHFIKQI